MLFPTRLLAFFCVFASYKQNFITINCNNVLDAAYCFHSNAQKMRHFKSRFFLLCEVRLLSRLTHNIKIAVRSWCIEGGSFQTRTELPTITLRHCSGNFFAHRSRWLSITDCHLRFELVVATIGLASWRRRRRRNWLFAYRRRWFWERWLRSDEAYWHCCNGYINKLRLCGAVAETWTSV